MKYPPKQTRSTCHRRVFVNQKFINQKTDTSDVHSKTENDEVAPPRLLQRRDGQLRPQDTVPSTTLLNPHRYRSPLELDVQHMKNQPTWEIPLCCKRRAANAGEPRHGRSTLRRAHRQKQPPQQRVEVGDRLLPQRPMGVVSHNTLPMLPPYRPENDC